MSQDIDITITVPVYVAASVLGELLELVVGRPGMAVVWSRPHLRDQMIEALKEALFEWPESRS